jgi:hypothetical protein
MKPRVNDATFRKYVGRPGAGRRVSHRPLHRIRSASDRENGALPVGRKHEPVMAARNPVLGSGADRNRHRRRCGERSLGGFDLQVVGGNLGARVVRGEAPGMMLCRSRAHGCRDLPWSDLVLPTVRFLTIPSNLGADFRPDDGGAADRIAVRSSSRSDSIDVPFAAELLRKRRPG